MKFLHAADVHLDSPLKGLERYEGAPVDEIRGATRRALENLVELAREQEVDFVLIAGDLYDGDWKDHNTGLFFLKQMVRLREANIPVFVITGNHDAANKMTRSLRLPENVQMLSSKKPETVILDELGVAIHGRGFAKAAELENLALDYPAARAGLFNIGLLHTCASGAEGHESYAPCTVADLRSKQYDYWALGHIHQRSVLHSEPLIMFPGNLQGRHIRESGEKGCLLVTVEERGEPQWQFHPLDVFRWQSCRVSAEGADRGEAVLDSFSSELAGLVRQSGGMPLAVRVELVGPCAAHQQLLSDPLQWTNQFRAAALDVADGRVWVEKVKFHTTAAGELDKWVLGDGPLGEIVHYIEQLRGDDEQLRALSEELAELQRRMPDDLLQGPDGLALDDPARLREVLDQVEPLLVSRLLSQENTR